MTQQCSPDSAKPVAWRVLNDFGHWYITQDEALANTYRDIEKKDVQPLYLAAAQSVRSQPLRDQFERWAETDHRAIEPEQFEDRADDNNQYYQDDSDNSAFIGWKAALSSAQRTDACTQSQHDRQEAKP